MLCFWNDLRQPCRVEYLYFQTTVQCIAAGLSLFWSKHNSQCLAETEDHMPQVMIRRGVTPSQVIDPDFFDWIVIGVLYLKTLRNYTRAFQQTDQGTGVVPAKWCSSSFHPDCAWIPQWSIPRPNPFANAMTSTQCQLDHTP